MRDGRPCLQVQARAKALFEELAQRIRQGTSPIFALIPDILSNLSSDATLPTQGFKDIMEELFRHIAKECKDKHKDELVARLVARIGPEQDLKAARVFIFCVQQLKPSVKVVRSFEDNLPSMKGFLDDDEFTTAVRVWPLPVLQSGVSATNSAESRRPCSCKAVTFHGRQ